MSSIYIDRQDIILYSNNKEIKAFLNVKKYYFTLELWNIIKEYMGIDSSKISQNIFLKKKYIYEKKIISQLSELNVEFNNLTSKNKKYIIKSKKQQKYNLRKKINSITIDNYDFFGRNHIHTNKNADNTDEIINVRLNDLINQNNILKNKLYQSQKKYIETEFFDKEAYKYNHIVVVRTNKYKHDNKLKIRSVSSSNKKKSNTKEYQRSNKIMRHLEIFKKYKITHYTSTGLYGYDMNKKEHNIVLFTINPRDISQILY